MAASTVDVKVTVTGYAALLRLAARLAYEGHMAHGRGTPWRSCLVEQCRADRATITRSLSAEKA